MLCDQRAGTDDLAVRSFRCRNQDHRLGPLLRDTERELAVSQRGLEDQQRGAMLQLVQRPAGGLLIDDRLEDFGAAVAELSQRLGAFAAHDLVPLLIEPRPLAADRQNSELGAITSHFENSFTGFRLSASVSGAGYSRSSPTSRRAYFRKSGATGERGESPSHSSGTARSRGSRDSGTSLQVGSVCSSRSGSR